MADLKISALPGASTPLAGTEVLPIVQSGSTKKVSVADLTAGRPVAMAGGSFTDNITQSTAAKGFNFTANTPAAGMTSRLLNWYEEGTWTPALSFGGATTGITYGTQFGQYTRIGRQVTLVAKVVLTSKGSATGLAAITGLPFNAAANVNSMTVVDPASSFSGIIVGGATLLSIATDTLYFLQQSLTDRTTMSQSNFGNTADFRFVIVYTV
jgi:hypothetical protein